MKLRLEQLGNFCKVAPVRFEKKNDRFSQMKLFGRPKGGMEKGKGHCQNPHLPWNIRYWQNFLLKQPLVFFHVIFFSTSSSFGKVGRISGCRPITLQKSWIRHRFKIEAVSTVCDVCTALSNLPAIVEGVLVQICEFSRCAEVWIDGQKLEMVY